MEDNIKLFTEVDKEISSIATEPQQKDYEVHLGIEYPEPSFTLSMGSVGTFPRGDIQAVKAKSKNGKTFLCSILIASMLGCDKFGFTSREETPTIIYFDTEQNPRNTARLVARVHTLLGWNTKQDDGRFRAYALRTMDIEQRFPYILDKVKELQPTAVFIDGVADLITNFNDVEQSSNIVNDLMRLSGEFNCCVCAVLHTNKAKDDSSMKGHLGTLLLQKASDVLNVRKDDSTFQVEETDCRNMPIDDFAFSIDINGIPTTAITSTQAKGQAKLDEYRNTLNVIFSKHSELSYTELVDAYALEVAVSERTAKRAVADMKQSGLIVSTSNKKYSII